MPRSPRSSFFHRTSAVALTLSAALMLAGCATNTTPQAGTDIQVQVQTQVAGQPQRVLSVKTAQVAETIARLGAHVLGQYGDETILGYTPAAGLSTQSLSALPGEENSEDAFQSSGNVGVWGSGNVGIWGSGNVGVWGSGNIGAWGSGSRSAWGSGLYTPLPGNTTVWNSVHLEEAQARSQRLGQGVTIAVVDSGVDLNHAAFAKSFTSRSTWADFVGGDTLPQEEGSAGDEGYGHGTAVAGIALQMAPGALVMPVRVLSPNGSGTPLSVALGVLWATANGADIVNLSLGSTRPSLLVQSAVAYARSQGVLVVAAAGNDGRNVSEYPARTLQPQTGGLDVGSSSTDGTARSDFSNYGSDLSVLAPGERIGSTYPGNGIATWNGTSMSTPVVSGELALGLSDGGTRSQLAQQVVTSADAVAGTAPRVNFDTFLRKLH